MSGKEQKGRRCRFAVTSVPRSGAPSRPCLANCVNKRVQQKQKCNEGRRHDAATSGATERKGRGKGCLDVWMPSPGLVTLRYFAVTENPI